MEQKFIRQPVILTFRGPLLTAGQSFAAWGLDVPFYRDWNNNLAIPGSLIRGKLRQSLTLIKTPDSQIKKWLGKKSSDEAASGGDAFKPIRGILKISDFILRNNCRSGDTTPRTRIRTDVFRKTVETGALLNIETPMLAGETSQWRGEVEFFSDEDKIPEWLDQLKKAFCFISSLGAEKTIGFGRLEQVDFDVTVKTGPGCCCISHIPEPLGVRLSLRPLEPFMIGGIRKTENIVISEDTIPGSTLKGAMAAGLNRMSGNMDLNLPITSENKNVMELYPNLAAYFTDLEFRHGLPSADKFTRPRAIPLSGAIYGSRFRDLAFESDDETLYADGTDPVCFQIDWKHPPADLPEIYQKPATSFHAVTRTAIEGKILRADESKLYSFYMIKPGNDDGPVFWNSEIRFPDETDTETRKQLTHEINEAIPLAFRYIGKRQSIMSVETEVISHAAADIPDGGIVSLTLQTPALMIDPATMKTEDEAIFDDTDKLYRAYAGYWESVFAGSAVLKRHYSAQELRGGFLGMRYIHNRYQPFYLTSAGSTFVFSINDKKKSRETLEKITAKNLPLPQWAQEQFSRNNTALWKNCPFPPENGFGEIAYQFKGGKV